MFSNKIEKFAIQVQKELFDSDYDKLFLIGSVRSCDVTFNINDLDLSTDAEAIAFFDLQIERLDEMIAEADEGRRRARHLWANATPTETAASRRLQSFQAELSKFQSGADFIVGLVNAVNSVDEAMRDAFLLKNIPRIDFKTDVFDPLAEALIRLESVMEKLDGFVDAVDDISGLLTTLSENFVRT